MTKVSRRRLAGYGADELLAGKSAAEVAKSLALILVESGRQDQVAFLLEDIAWELENRKALTMAKITSARRLDHNLEIEIKRQLKKSTGAKEVAVTNNLDSSVVGGVRIETASRLWDLTIKRKLLELKEAF